MTKSKKVIWGRTISPNVVIVKDSEHSELIPGQKVLLYKTTGRDIVSASGEVIGKKERVLGIGEAKIDGGKMIIRSSPKNNPALRLKLKQQGYIRGKLQAVNQKNQRRIIASRTVLIKPIEE